MAVKQFRLLTFHKEIKNVQLWNISSTMGPTFNGIIQKENKNPLRI